MILASCCVVAGVWQKGGISASRRKLLRWVRAGMRSLVGPVERSHRIPQAGSDPSIPRTLIRARHAIPESGCSSRSIPRNPSAAPRASGTRCKCQTLVADEILVFRAEPATGGDHHQRVFGTAQNLGKLLGLDAHQAPANQFTSGQNADESHGSKRPQNSIFPQSLSLRSDWPRKTTDMVGYRDKGSSDVKRASLRGRRRIPLASRPAAG